MSYSQLPVFRPVPAAPLKSSAKTWVQPDGGGGSDAATGVDTDTAAAAARTRAAAKVQARAALGDLRAMGCAPFSVKGMRAPSRRSLLIRKKPVNNFGFRNHRSGSLFHIRLSHP